MCNLLNMLTGNPCNNARHEPFSSNSYNEPVQANLPPDPYWVYFLFTVVSSRSFTRVTRMAYSPSLWLMAIGWWNKINQCQGLQGLQGWPTARVSGWWQLAGETKSTSVENWNYIWHKLEESVWVLIQECIDLKISDTVMTSQERNT